MEWLNSVDVGWGVGGVVGGKSDAPWVGGVGDGDVMEVGRWSV